MVPFNVSMFLELRRQRLTLLKTSQSRQRKMKKERLQVPLTTRLQRTRKEGLRARGREKKNGGNWVWTKKEQSTEYRVQEGELMRWIMNKTFWAYFPKFPYKKVNIHRVSCQDILLKQWSKQLTVTELDVSLGSSQPLCSNCRYCLRDVTWLHWKST